MWTCSRKLLPLGQYSSFPQIWKNATSNRDSRPGIKASQLVVGYSYLINLTFTVVVPAGTRMHSTSVIVVPTADPVPFLAINGLPQSSRISSTSRLALTADAKPHASSDARQSDIGYLWSATRTDNMGIATSPPAVVHLPSPAQQSLVISTQTFPSGLLAGATYTFRVDVTDTLVNTMTFTEVQLSVSFPPVVNTVHCFPTKGIAFRQSFAAAAAANATDLPMLYRFSYETSHSGGSGIDSFLLTSWTAATTYNSTLPTGNHTFSVEVIDGLGTVAKKKSNSEVFVYSEPATTTGSSSPTLCELFSRTDDSIISVLQSSGYSKQYNATRLDENICEYTRQGVDALVSGALFDGYLVAARHITLILPRYDDHIAALSLNLSPSAITCSRCNGAGAGSAGSTPTTSPAYSLWSALFAGVVRLVLTPQIGVRTHSQGLEALSSLSKSKYANESVLSTLADTLATLVDYSTNSDLAFGPDGVTAATNIDQLIKLANISTSDTELIANNNSVSANISTRCALINQARHLADNLLAKAGSALVPSETAVSFKQVNFEGDARVSFADESIPVTATGNPNISLTLPPLVGSLGSSSTLSGGERPRSIVSISIWLKILQECRKFSNISNSSVDSTIISVVVTGTNSTDIGSTGNTGGGGDKHVVFQSGSMLLYIPLDVNTDTEYLSSCESGSAHALGVKNDNLACKYWDVAQQGWNGSACELVRIEGRRALCKCRHLTEFALIKNSQVQAGDCNPTVDESHLIASTTFYSLITAGFLAAAVVTSMQLYRVSKQKKLRNSSVCKSHILLLVQCLARCSSTLLLGGFVGGASFTSIGSAALLVLTALPYSCSFWTYTYILFQWIAITHNTAMSRKPFERFKKIFLGVNITIVALVWALFAVAIFAAAQIENMYLIGSVMMAVLCVIIGVLTLTYAYSLHRKIQSIRPRGQGKQPRNKQSSSVTTSLRKSSQRFVDSKQSISSIDARSDSESSLPTLSPLSSMKSGWRRSSPRMLSLPEESRLSTLTLDEKSSSQRKRTGSKVKKKSNTSKLMRASIFLSTCFIIESGMWVTSALLFNNENALYFCTAAYLTADLLAVLSVLFLFWGSIVKAKSNRQSKDNNKHQVIEMSEGRTNSRNSTARCNTNSVEEGRPSLPALPVARMSGVDMALMRNSINIRQNGEIDFASSKRGSALRGSMVNYSKKGLLSSTGCLRADEGTEKDIEVVVTDIVTETTSSRNENRSRGSIIV